MRSIIACRAMSTSKVVHIVRRTIFIVVLVLSIVEQIHSQVDNGTYTDGNVDVDPHGIVGTTTGHQ